MDSLQSKSFQLDELMPLFRETLAEGKNVTFYPRGISMLPMIRQGKDSVTLKPISGRLKKYDIPLYQRDNGGYVLHRVVKVGETYTCIGDNQFVEERGLRHDQMIAVVSSFTRNGKIIPMTDVRYQLYCRFWHFSRPARYFLRRVKRFVRRKIHK